MNISHETNLWKLVTSSVGATQATWLLKTLKIDPHFAAIRPQVSPSEMAMALNALLFSELLGRVPSGASYVDEAVTAGRRITFDHGALRTIHLSGQAVGTLPQGADAIARILAPLGYAQVHSYPLPALGMTGHAWCHCERPETVPQFFVSELHVERFSGRFQEAAARVFGKSNDPLGPMTHEVLEAFSSRGSVPFTMAASALTSLIRAFDRHHDICELDDYECLLAESAEAAWIATEGNAFNHATDRVPDVVDLADRLRDEGWPIKPKVEHSESGRVRQTAFRADPVERRFRDGDAIVARTVPGSFYEFISRDIDPATGRLDLAFDSSNAQGIFAMTRAA